LPYQLPLWLWPTTLMAVCALAVWRGGDDERLAAGGNLANWAMSLVVFKARSEDIQWAVFMFDVGLTALLLWIAMRSPRYWPLFAAGFQVLIVATHIGRAIDPRITGWAYLTAQLVWAYLVLIAVGYGALTARRRYAEIDGVLAMELPGATRR
jgi:hypothetical protein